MRKFVFVQMPTMFFAKMNIVNLYKQFEMPIIPGIFVENTLLVKNI